MGEDLTVKDTTLLHRDTTNSITEIGHHKKRNRHHEALAGIEVEVAKSTIAIARAVFIIVNAAAEPEINTPLMTKVESIVEDTQSSQEDTVRMMTNVWVDEIARTHRMLINTVAAESITTEYILAMIHTTKKNRRVLAPRLVHRLRSNVPQG